MSKRIHYDIIDGKAINKKDGTPFGKELPAKETNGRGRLADEIKRPEGGESHDKKRSEVREKRYKRF